MPVITETRRFRVQYRYVGDSQHVIGIVGGCGTEWTTAVNNGIKWHSHVEVIEYCEKMNNSEGNARWEFRPHPEN